MEALHDYFNGILQPLFDSWNLTELNETSSDDPILNMMLTFHNQSFSETWEQVQQFSSKAYYEAYESAMGFYHAVDWKEPLVIGIGVAHLILLVIWFLLLRRSPEARMVYFVILSALVFSSSYINDWAAENWERFSTQNYFDKSAGCSS
eukprot:Sspe_Gene.98092::Locus_71546_Transcript_1_1_Confidence_1.000_Length_830::g.98092::m.98092/K22145/TMEM18; transmembrane protein 18